ncbi:ribosomal protein S10 [Hesseltinella vesiculosa]|uniref:Small ribosomal subunit protein uS10m n=1 Tax=Hesseltinella vesiculosa TaxID=101127 RepID=A0A1X2G666_9FUNG|nr:ribosomal protein S10 [Hesseltinella vesiculosa]
MSSSATTSSVKEMQVPTATETETISEVFEVPKRVAPTHDIPVCNLQLRGYLPQQLDFFADFAQRAAFHLGMPCSGTVPLPTQTSKWTVIKSPFVHKKSQENFERKTHKRLLQIKDSHPEVVDRWLRYLTMNAPAGIGLRATRFEHESLKQ